MSTKPKIENGGMKFKKKSSPLKLLSQSQLGKRTIQGSFHQNLVGINPAVSEEEIFM
jgi:hypothetical protein